MRAQISLELLFSFLFEISIVLIFLLALNSFSKSLDSHSGRMSEISAAEEVARSLDSFASSGKNKYMKIENASYRIGERIIFDYNDKIIVISTIAGKGEMNGEPV